MIRSLHTNTFHQRTHSISPQYRSRTTDSIPISDISREYTSHYKGVQLLRRTTGNTKGQILSKVSVGSLLHNCKGGLVSSTYKMMVIRPVLVPSTGLLVLLDFVSLFLSFFLYMYVIHYLLLAALATVKRFFVILPKNPKSH